MKVWQLVLIEQQLLDAHDIKTSGNNNRRVKYVVLVFFDSFWYCQRSAYSRLVEINAVQL